MKTLTLANYNSATDVLKALGYEKGLTKITTSDSSMNQPIEKPRSFLEKMAQAVVNNGDTMTTDGLAENTRKLEQARSVIRIIDNVLKKAIGITVFAEGNLRSGGE